jgi:sialic acid synthase SpsE/spore coat polysaccharide biosynthesis protein SpsF (cytidylyltransferase family)
MLSSRFRGKSLVAVAGKPLLVRVIERAQAMPFIDEVVVATSLAAADEPIVTLVESRGIRCVRGEELDVLDRYVQAADGLAQEDCVVRFTADNPLYDPSAATQAWNAHASGYWDYTHLDGLSHVVPELIRVGALRQCDALARDAFDREHVTPFLRKHRDDFKVQTLPPDFAGIRPELDRHLTIDTQDDLDRLERMFSDLEPLGSPVPLSECYLWLDRKRGRFNGAIVRERGQLRVNLAGYEVGDGCPTFIVAEIGQNHNGEMGIAKRLIEMAARCGADAVKFQKRDIRWELTDEAYNRPYEGPNSFGATYGAHREFLELGEDQHRDLREYALAHGLVYMCTACDDPSVDVMERIGNPIYKVASRDITNIPLLWRIARTRKPVILSTGMAGLSEIREALEALDSVPPAIILLQAISQYPADLERVNLRAMQTMRREFKLLTGLSDHTAGVISSVAASVMGACVIEKHITLARAMKGSDHAGSLEEEGLRRMVRYIRDAELAMGDGQKKYDDAAEPARLKLARSLTTRIAVTAGTVLTEEMLTLRSPGTGLSWRDRHQIVGKIAVRDMRANQTCYAEDFTALQPVSAL